MPMYANYGQVPHKELDGVNIYIAKTPIKQIKIKKENSIKKIFIFLLILLSFFTALVYPHYNKIEKSCEVLISTECGYSIMQLFAIPLPLTNIVINDVTKKD